MYSIQGFQSFTQNGCDAERNADTIKDARRQARYMLSESYRVASEATEKLSMVQIWKGDKLIQEFDYRDE